MLFSRQQKDGTRHRLPFSGLEEDGNTWKVRIHTKNSTSSIIKSFHELNIKSSYREVLQFGVLNDGRGSSRNIGSHVWRCVLPTPWAATYVIICDLTDVMHILIYDGNYLTVPHSPICPTQTKFLTSLVGGLSNHVSDIYTPAPTVCSLRGYWINRVCFLLRDTEVVYASLHVSFKAWKEGCVYLKTKC